MIILIFLCALCGFLVPLCLKIFCQQNKELFHKITNQIRALRHALCAMRLALYKSRTKQTYDSLLEITHDRTPLPN
jgi:hypothetical protein